MERSITNAIDRIKKNLPDWLHSNSTQKKAPDESVPAQATLRRIDQLSAFAVPYIDTNYACMPDVTLVGNVYFIAEEIKKDVESGSEEEQSNSLVSRSGSEETKSSCSDYASVVESTASSSEPVQLPAKNDSLLTPVKREHAVFSVNRIKSGTPVSTAKKFPHIVDLNTPGNPDLNRRPRYLDGRHLFTPVALNLTSDLNLSSDESSSD